MQAIVTERRRPVQANNAARAANSNPIQGAVHASNQVTSHAAHRTLCLQGTPIRRHGTHRKCYRNTLSAHTTACDDELHSTAMNSTTCRQRTALTNKKNQRAWEGRRICSYERFSTPPQF